MKRAGIVMLACVLVGVVGPAAQAEAEPTTTCAGAVPNTTYRPPDAGVATAGLGEGAPAYYEIGAPSGQHRGKKPKAIMLVIHGGAWYMVGREAAALWGRPMANRWRSAGWQTVNVDYRPCAQSIHDVLWFMQRVRQLHPHSVICATGSSAGAHLAMLLATMRPDLACVIAHAGPSDLISLDRQFAFDGHGGLTQAGPRLLSSLAVAAFGARPVSRSPRQLAAHITARVLLATGRTDPLIPRAQDKAFAKTLRALRPDRYVDVLSLPPGDEYFVHTYVSRESLRELRIREEALVAPLVGLNLRP